MLGAGAAREETAEKQRRKQHSFKDAGLAFGGAYAISIGSLCVVYKGYAGDITANRSRPSLDGELKAEDSSTSTPTGTLQVGRLDITFSLG